MKITPDPCTCNDHRVDLTALVRDAIVSKVPVSSFGVHLGIGRRKARPKTYTVVVTCPGTKPDKKAHPIRFSGTYE